jgi:hypothetical protein
MQASPGKNLLPYFFFHSLWVSPKPQVIDIVTNIAPPALFFPASGALARGRLLLAIGTFSFGFVFGADRTGFGSSSGTTGFLLRLLGADRTRLFTASTALAFGSCRGPQGRAGSGNRSGQAESGQYLFKMVLFHAFTPFFIANG